MTTPAQQPPILWEPSAQRIEDSNLVRYTRWLFEHRGLSFGSYQDLWEWSTSDLEGFWSSIWQFFDVSAQGPYEQVLSGRRMPGAQWFVGSELNYAEHVFRGKPDDQLALVQASELRAQRDLSWGELRSQTARIAAGLRSLGVGPGDRVAAYLPNIAETVASFLACASIGAVWSSAAPEFGARSVIDRFAQIEPKVLLTIDGYRYNGRDFDRLDAVATIQAELGGLEQTVVVPYLRQDPELGGLEGAIGLDELESRGQGARLSFTPVGFSHPLWVLYSSGTTGLPKAIVQGHGGILVEQLKKLHLHTDAQSGDRLFWFTTTGWMMWNFLIGGLLTDAAIVLYDGSPGFPDMGALWRLAESAKITCFGTSAAYIGACMNEGIEPGKHSDLRALRSMGCTGSPLSPEGFRWVYERVDSDIWLFSTSGGTDVCTAFVGGVPTLPVYEGELQGRSLGAKVEAFDEQGQALIDQVGELVITEPMPSMPLYLWNDPDGQRYRDSYFDLFPGVWRHGDWIKITSRGTAVIYGRSDSTINRGGVRMGTAEIYRAVQRIPEVTDALVVDLPQSGSDTGWMPLFVVLRAGTELDSELGDEIKRRIRSDCSPRHVPNAIYAVDEIPRTLSGKILEVPVKKILMGTDPNSAASRDSLANPRALDYFVDLAKTL